MATDQIHAPRAGGEQEYDGQCFTVPASVDTEIGRDRQDSQ